MVIFTGNTVEEAIQAGLSELGIERVKSHIVVMSREKKGFLGIGKKQAIVDVEAIDNQTVNKANQKAVRGVPERVNSLNEPVQSVSESTVELGKVVAAVKEYEAKQGEIDETVKSKILQNNQDIVEILQTTGHQEVVDRVIKPESDEVGEEAADLLQDYFTKVVSDMGIAAEISYQVDGYHIQMQINTEFAGRIIGYHAKILKALQLLGQNILHDKYSKQYGLSINVNDYDEEREKTLKELAHKKAERVLLTGESYRMEHMSNKERKIIHEEIATIEGVESYSAGDHHRRFVVIQVAPSLS